MNFLILQKSPKNWEGAGSYCPKKLDNLTLMKLNVSDLCIKKNIQTINTNPEKSLKVPHNRQVNSNIIKEINCITVDAQFSWSLGEILILNMLVAAMTPLDCLKHTILVQAN